ncbi:hypothetical protein [Bifidobacterium moukalabense]|uniref:hypothetical protein n=1 Tax=Bifidobacterium moukalabense TaxID=1333651 RepID=UPI0010F9363A|nr:hypothetical protein [Bifidobacterium moukalabense]
MVGIAPDIFLNRTILYKLYVTNQRHAVTAGEVADACLGIVPKMRSLSVQLGTLGCDKNSLKIRRSRPCPSRKSARIAVFIGEGQRSHMAAVQKHSGLGFYFDNPFFLNLMCSLFYSGFSYLPAKSFSK